ncbi:MAG TPA: protein kinase [Candidatus Acidoferrum sp.]|nr:protein kinase [Candidatus Acidoferrum sp.]
MSQDYAVGQKLGDYEILGILGAGGMGKVYKVRNTISDRVEAMKILLPDLAGQKDLADRFLREIKLLASLSHPNIAALRTALTLDNQLVMIMEYVDGVTLSSRLQEGAIPPSLAVKYIDQVLNALSYAHKQNIIHRDIKPANMMLTSDGTVKLMDFGIARSSTDRSLTMTGTTLGSLNYMPPEQVKGEPADNRSDLYSLGVSLYELVTGQLPFQAESNYAMMAAHLQEDPKPPIVLRPGIPQPLNQIILMAMAKDPGNRFQSADAFRGALKNVQAHGAGTQPAVDPRSYAPTSAATAGGATALFQETPASQSPTTVLDTPAYQRTQPAAAAETPLAPPPPAVRTGGHRGLYIALGAFIVVAVLFVAGLYLPGHLKTLAGAGKHSPSTQQAQPADSSASTPASSTPSTPADAATPGSATATPGDASATTPSTSPSTATGSSPTTTGAQAPQAGQPSADASGTPSTPATDSSAAAATTAGAGGAPTPPAKKPSSAKSRKNSQSATQSRDVVPPASGSNASQPQTEAAAQAEEVEQKYTDVDSRSVAATQTLDNLQRQQAAAGYGLRSDIVSAQQRMKADLNKAQYYMQKQDSKNAKKYLDMADAELQTIEKFLGR